LLVRPNAQATLRMPPGRIKVGPRHHSALELDNYKSVDWICRVRREAFSPCPLDGKELLLEDAECAYADDRVEDNVSCETGSLPKKG